MRISVTLTLFAALSTAAAFGQQDHSSTLASARSYQKTIGGYELRAAEKVSGADFAFQATPEVRSLGQLIGHVADANNNYCAAALGEANPNPGIEKGKTAKADLTAALKAALEYCDRAYTSLSEANANQMMKFRNGERSKLSLLMFNTMHMNEHYGNIVTYMRLKGMMPPSSER